MFRAWSARMGTREDRSSGIHCSRPGRQRSNRMCLCTYYGVDSLRSVVLLLFLSSPDKGPIPRQL